MKKDDDEQLANIETETNEMRSEYDLSKLTGRTRGKYTERYQAGTNLILLEPDVAAAFPDAAAVNQALRLLMEVANRRDLRR